VPEIHGCANSAPILIAGGTGTLGSAFARICTERGLAHRLLCRRDMDIADPGSIARAFELWKPWALINAAGYVRVDEAEDDAERCFRENTLGPEVLAQACELSRVRLVTFSTDLVFDGARREPYVEDDRVGPLNVYGLSKARAEERVLERNPSALVVRTSAFFGPWDSYNYVSVLLRTLEAGQEFFAADDMVVSPTYIPDLVNACLDLLIDEESGRWHLANRGALTWAELAQRAARLAGADASKVRPCRTEKLGLRARRPAYSALSSARTPLLPSVDHALGRFIANARTVHLRR
jgi:dTDP-4-dehydrorhamnose reductase